MYWVKVFIKILTGILPSSSRDFFLDVATLKIIGVLVYLFHLIKLKREERKNMAVGVKEGVDGILILLNLFIITYSIAEFVYN